MKPLRHRLAGWPLVPAAAWGLSKTVACAAALSLSLAPQDPLTWARFDSFHFLSIAARGYQLVYMPLTMNGHTTLWSGNTETWPLYAWLARALSGLPLSLPLIALALSSFFQLTMYWLLWDLWLKREAPERGLPLMALAAVFPGMIYFNAISSFTLFLTLTLAFLHLCGRQRWVAAAAAGVVVGTAHTSSLFLVPAVALWALRRPFSRRALIGAGAAAAAVLAGFGLIFVVMRIQTGYWDAGPKAWEFHRYAGGWSLLRLRQMLYIPPIAQITETAKAVIVAQGLLAAGLCVLAAWGRRRDSRSGSSLLLIYVWVFWLAPHLSPLRQSYYRNEAALLPVLPLLAWLPTRLLVALASISAIIAFVMSRQFFLSILI